MDVGVRIARLRGGMTQASFSARLGVDRKTVERWEAGERLPDGAKLLRLVLEFGADLNYLLTGERNEALQSAEHHLIENYRRCGPEQRALLIQSAALLAAGIAAPTADKKTSSVQVTAHGGNAAGRDMNINSRRGDEDGAAKNRKPARKRSGT